MVWVSVALIPLLAPVAYFIGWETPSSLPGHLKANAARYVVGALSVEALKEDPYVRQQQNVPAIGDLEGMPSMGQMLIKWGFRLLFILLTVAVIGVNVYLISILR